VPCRFFSCAHSLSIAISAAAVLGAQTKPLTIQAPNPVDKAGEAAVHLEAHGGRTQFKIGDPVILDLVFTSKSSGYIVKTDNSPYLPISDGVNIAPDRGWVRTHASLRGQGLNGNAISTLTSDPIRVPVLLNRTITFLEPGHYQVTITTERLRTSENMMRTTSVDKCEPCRTTNAVGIDISKPDRSEESARVVSLSRELEDTAQPPDSRLSEEQTGKIDREVEELRQSGGSPEAEKRQEAMLRKLSELVASRQSGIQKRNDARREAAVKLACLDGDDAIRAKVHFIAAEQEAADPDISIAWVLVDGLANSRNKRLQLSLLEEAWRDPQLLPTDALQTALRQARELTQKGWVTDEAGMWAGTPAEHQATLEEYQREIHEIVATMPLRSESNRAETIKFFKALAVPNPFNQSDSPTSQPK
jgi:hypothetical protein